MSLLSSAVKMPSSSEGSSSGVKIKRKSRRRRTLATGTSTSEEPERCQIEYEVPRERTRQSRRAHRDVLNVIDSAAGDVKSSSKRRSNIVNSNGENGSSRRTPTHSHQRHFILSGTGTPSLVAPTSKNQSEVSQEAGVTARRTLISSASAIRLLNRKRLDGSQLGTEAGCLGHRRSSNHNNNNSEFDDDDQHLKPFGNMGAGPETFSITGNEDWLTDSRASNNNAATRVTLPSRTSKYRNLSAGVNKKPRVRVPAVPATKELSDRPPSRQRHAFPTHLIDANAFDAPETTGRRGGSSSSSTSTSSARTNSHRGSLLDSSTPPEGTTTTDRPPSRYMVKAKRTSTQGLTQDATPPSRRDVVDKSIVFSCNQSHHDPKTDGFADVDESVPPPFRIKVTTDATLDLPSDTRSTPPNAQRWPFSNQEQLLRMAVRGGNDQAMTTDLDAAQSQLQWFGKDDQINNAHLFETIISLSSPRPTVEPHVDVAIEDDLEDNDGPQYDSHKVISKQEQPQHDTQQHVETHFPSRRAAAASKMATPTTTLSETDNPELQWIRSSTNPFFVTSSSTVDYDSMDPETAIEQTPLYSSEDLMTLAATEMTDLRLDDYTALGDASMPAPPPSTAGMGWGGSRLAPSSRSPPLGTSLGNDFLSLFAQH